ncbi:DUF6165 family protein [Bacteriovorax sp. Seq25_V]|uniref:DUF6165 family protein n=1 Tax=Bacteriovorax sp. Seq25_V TaxID=1201288 RepID=UPI00038A3D5D|nr:DUF6165 family protein [Bacteriovorax sp. Seq25_V]EQC45663.1 hypothetical protein M900_2194 [Bacteriovorax sp. Seq25_V]
MMIECSVSLGELVDKITILEIKQEKIKDDAKQLLIADELSALNTKLQALNLNDLKDLKDELRHINHKLWLIEDDIRDKESAKEFDQDFIELARSVYITNDLRFKVKNLINMRYNSTIKEVKSYKGY